MPDQEVKRLLDRLFRAWCVIPKNRRDRARLVCHQKTYDVIHASLDKMAKETGVSNPTPPLTYLNVRMVIDNRYPEGDIAVSYREEDGCAT